MLDDMTSKADFSSETLKNYIKESVKQSNKNYIELNKLSDNFKDLESKINSSDELLKECSYLQEEFKNNPKSREGFNPLFVAAVLELNLKKADDDNLCVELEGII